MLQSYTYEFLKLYWNNSVPYVGYHEIDLHNQGIIRSIGINKDTGGSNGAGKTSIPSMLSGILYDTVANKHLVGPDSLYRGVVFNNKLSNSKIEIVQFYKLSKKTMQQFREKYSINESTTFKATGYLIFVNDKDVTPHGIPACRKKIASLFSLNRDEFYTSVLVSPTRAHILMEGSAPERRNYFETSFSTLSSFKLLQEKISSRKEKISEILSELEEYHVKLSTYREQRAIIKDVDLLEGLLEEVSKKVEKLEEKRSEHSERISKLEKQLFSYNKRKEILAQLESLGTVSKEDYENAVTSKKKANSKKDELTEIRSSVIKKQHLKERLKKLKESLPEDHSLKDLKTKVKSLSSKRKDCEHEKRKAKDILRDFESLSSNKECPTCHQEIPSKLLNENIKKYKKLFDDSSEKLSSLESKIAKYEDSIEKLEEYSEVKAEYESINVEFTDVDELDKKIKLCKKSIVEAEEIISIHTKRATVEATLEKYPEVEKPNKDKIESLKEDYKKFDDDYKLHIAEQSTYKMQIDQAASLDSKIKKLSKRVVDLPKYERKMKIVKALEKVYGPRGLILSQISNLASKLAERLPIYANILHQEQGMKFSTNTEKENFDLGVYRKHAPNTFVDFRDFSSGEKKRTIPALIIAQRDLQPLHKRCNLIVCDELDANLDSIAKDALVNFLIPLLKKKFPTVIMVDHGLEWTVPPDKTFYSIKKNGVTNLKVK